LTASPSPPPHQITNITSKPARCIPTNDQQPRKPTPTGFYPGCVRGLHESAGPVLGRALGLRCCGDKADSGLRADVTGGGVGGSRAIACLLTTHASLGLMLRAILRAML
jgi:hypothetical protein